MKKKHLTAGVLLLTAAAAAAVFLLAPEWSKRSFEATVRETVAGPDGEVRLIVRRTTEVYGDPVNALCISPATQLTGSDGEAITVTDIKPGDTVSVQLKDSFIEETPFYYPTVYAVRVIA